MAEIYVSSDPHYFHAAMFTTFLIDCPDCAGSGAISSDTGLLRECPVCQTSGQIPARPFSTMKEMNEFMLERHNEIVKPSHHHYCLGDLTMLRNGSDKKIIRDLVKRHNGHKRLYLGNHDQFPIVFYAEIFEKVRAYSKLDNLLFSHIPIERSSIPRGMVNVHGHVHTNPSPKGPYINVSMEAINYIPVNVDWLKEKARELLAKNETA